MIHSTSTPFVSARLRTAALALSVTAIAAMAGITSARADAETYKIDSNHSNVGFKVSHLAFSKVSGRFDRFEGSIRLDPADFSTASVEVSIDATSVDTNEEGRDKHLKSDAFFDVEKFPKLTFKSTKVVSAGSGKLKVEGNLTIKGVTKPVTLDVDVIGVGPDGMGGQRAGFEAGTRINRLDYGVSWNNVLDGGGLMVGNDVDILLGIEARRVEPAKAGAEGSSH